MVKGISCEDSQMKVRFNNNNLDKQIKLCIFSEFVADHVIID